MDQFSREEILLGKEKVNKLKNSKVLVFGLGGVGSYVVEGLARAGIGNFILVDKDIVDITNINRQLVAYLSTVGKNKTEVEKARIADINENAKVEIITEYFDKDSDHSIFDGCDYVVDAIDCVTSKLDIIETAKAKNIPVISAMGTGFKYKPEHLKIDDISKTTMCPLAKVIRKKLREKGIKHVKVLYSTEQPVELKNKETVGTVSYMPSMAGLMIASQVIRDLAELD
jgi:tRNA A37 threonylcarbamoyladenosine dehydratase